MATSTVNHRARRRAGGAATAIAALVTAAALTPGVASAQPSASTAGTQKVLTPVEMSSNGGGKLTELLSVTPNDRYLLMHQYEGKRVASISWQKDTLGGTNRQVNAVVITPGQRTWYASKRTVPPLPPHTFGIRSTPAEVQTAIKNHRAYLD